MSRYILIGSDMIEIPRYMRVNNLPMRAVHKILDVVNQGVEGDIHAVTTVDALKLRDGSIVRVSTVRSGGLIYWLVQDWSGKHDWAGGFFREGHHEHKEEAAVALPAIRGRGLYRAVLTHIRKTYKKALISDRSLSRANILSWIRAGSVIGTHRFKINPAKPWITDFIALETITI